MEHNVKTIKNHKRLIYKMIKANYSISLFILILFFSFNCFADIQLSLQPTPVVAGEPASLTISSTEGKAIIENLPDIPSLSWSLDNNNYNKSIITINGKSFEQTIYKFSVSKSGIITLPSMEIVTDKDSVFTQEKKIRVVKGPLSNLDNRLFIKAKYDINQKNKIYTGEEIPLKINFYRADNISAVPLEYPKITMSNIVFDDFSKFNKENDRFAPYPYGAPEQITKEDDDTFTKSTFLTSFRALGSGPLNGSVSLLCNIKLPQRNRLRSSRYSSFFDNDSFFSDSFFGRGDNNLSKLLTAKLPELNILPLPTAPANTKFLGLVGKWSIESSLASNKVKEGEPVTLSLKISGTGTLENLNAPELLIPGFTVYSPEIQKDGSSTYSSILNKATINYVMVPTESGKTNIDISFATFNPETEKYDINTINKSIQILPNKNSSESFVYSNTIAKDKSYSPKKTSKQNKICNVILYLKKNPGKNVLLPLWFNHIVLIAILIFLGPLLWIIIELIYLKQKKLGGNVKLQRKNSAVKRKNKVIKAIMNSNSDSFPEVIQKEAIPYINDLKGFPPGTTPEELASKLNEKQLVENLKEVNALSYMPSLKEEDCTALKKNLIKALKKLSVILIIGFSTSLVCNQARAENNSNNNIDQLFNAYNKAEFNKAENICKANIKSNSLNPNWLYNLGNCCYQNGNLADALVYYERALRLDPRSSDILENLNFVRRKLFLPELYQGKTPLAVLKSFRDSFRPDEWIVIFAFGWFIIFIGLILRRFTIGKVWISMLSVGFAIAILSIVAYTTEKSQVYNPNSAIVIERNVKIFTLPSKDSPKANFILSPGDQVKIQEKINKWIRVRKNKSEGWVNQNSIKRIWPY